MLTVGSGTDSLSDTIRGIGPGACSVSSSIRFLSKASHKIGPGWLTVGSGIGALSDTIRGIGPRTCSVSSSIRFLSKASHKTGSGCLTVGSAINSLSDNIKRIGSGASVIRRPQNRLGLANDRTDAAEKGGRIGPIPGAILHKKGGKPQQNQVKSVRPRTDRSNGNDGRTGLMLNIHHLESFYAELGIRDFFCSAR